jgi:beta-glucosidase
MEIYKNPEKSTEERVEDLLSRMTLEEKCAQLCGDLPFEYIHEENLDAVLKEKFPYGHGRFTQYSMAGLADPVQIAEFTNKLQHYFVEETRLGIPVALQSENLCGYPAMGGTLFPAQCNVGCTWAPELAEKMAEIIGQESRSVGINSAMSPVIDVSRDPRWGRTYETYGEDPYLISQMGIHYIKGMQKNKKDGVACVAKHFLGYAETQGGLNTAVTRLNDRELYEVFATPFEAASKEANVSSVMANYAEIDGMCVVQNRKIAHDLLRDTMGFDGILTSDGAGIMKTYTYFHTADTYEEAGLLAKKAGTDTEIPVGGAFRQLPKYVKMGELDEKLIDESCRRVLKVKFEYGLFEHPYVDVAKVREAMRNPEKEALSEEIAAKSLVLLQNDGVLPLRKGTRIALIGPHADNLRYPVSGYTFPAYVEMLTAGMKGENVGFNGIADEQNKADEEGNNKKATAKGPFAAMSEAMSKEDWAKLGDMHKVLRDMHTRSLKEVLEDRFTVNYAKGCDILSKETSGFEDAVKAAEQSDVVIMACGGNSGWVNVTGGEGKDRAGLGLPGVQQKLLETVAAVGKKVILVLYGPGIFALPWAKEHTSAMLQAFMPGPFAGKAVADVLDGTVNPGGKLTMTIPRSVGQIPVTYNHRTGSGYGQSDSIISNIFSGGYVDESDAPLFYFGEGKSYTSFRLSDFAVDKDVEATDGCFEISCTVTNTGEYAGDEVVQLYYHTKKAHVVRPVMQLAGFKRISLDKGKSKRVSFTLSTRQLGYYNEFMEFVVEPTTMDLMLGTSSKDIAFTKEVKLVGNSLQVSGRRVYTCDATVTDA